MARLFSLDVPFENRHYTALVSVDERGEDISCTVRYIDKKIRHILPGDQLVFCLKGGLKEPKHLPGELAQSLFQSTTSALTMRLNERA